MKILFIILLLLFSFNVFATTYYFSSSGNNSNTGTSTGSPWQTLGKLNSFWFGGGINPGDSILFKRGETFIGEFDCASSGTSGNPVVIAGYGAGTFPIFQYDVAGAGATPVPARIIIFGDVGISYITITGIKFIDTTMNTTNIHTATLANVGYAVDFDGGTVTGCNNIILNNLDISLVGNAIEIKGNNNTVSNCNIHDLGGVVNVSGPSGIDNFGANAVSMSGSNNLITRNTFTNLWRTDLYFSYDGGAIEMFGAIGGKTNNNVISYNTSVNGDGFMEMGSGVSADSAYNNVFVYNLFINHAGRIVTVHNGGDGFSENIGNIQLYNNSIVETTVQYSAYTNVLWSSSATATNLVTMRNNVFWLTTNVDVTKSGGFFSGAQLVHTNNIYHLNGGSLNFTLGGTELNLGGGTAVFNNTSNGNPALWDYTLIAGSPAIDFGTSVGYSLDFAGASISGNPDAGIYENASVPTSGNYYFSNETVNDISGNGSIGNPWQSITKLNSIFSSLSPGDNVYFARGERFYGMINVSQSGTTGQPITLTAYGSGAKPVVDGFVTLNSWTNLGGGMYEIVNSALDASLNMLTIDGVSYAMGRYPNTGYNTFEFHTGTTSITDNQLTTNPYNWTGAQVVIRTSRFSIDRRPITNHVGGTLTYSGSITYEPSNGFGYFIQNDIRTLDQYGEWNYNPGSKKVTMYLAGVNPNTLTIKAASVDTLLNMYDLDNLVVDGVDFEGANLIGINFYSADIGTSRILNCNIKYSGGKGIVLGNSKNVYVNNCQVTDCNVYGIFMSTIGNYYITNNTIKRIAIFQGMAGAVNENTAIRCTRSAGACYIENNIIDSVGWSGIRFTGDSIIVRKNFIQHFCYILDDGAGVYTYAGASAVGRRIVSNICMNGMSPLAGQTSAIGATNGIYLDDNTSGVVCDSNSVANINKNGFFLHNDLNCFLRFNTSYNAGQQQIHMLHNSPNSNFRNMVVSNNIFVSKLAAQYTLQSQTDGSDLAFDLWGFLDNNYHGRPIAQTTIIRGVNPSVAQNYTIPAWYAVSTHEQFSQGSPKTYAGTINPDDSIRFEYNATTSNKVIALPGTFTDVTGAQFVNSITLPAFRSAVLMKTITSSGSSSAPVVTLTDPVDGSTYAAGSDITFTANVTDDGTISTVKFYNGATLLATITDAPYVFTWVNVPPGTYTITAVALDDTNTTGTSADATITVTGAVTPSSGSIKTDLKLIVQ